MVSISITNTKYKNNHTDNNGDKNTDSNHENNDDNAEYNNRKYHDVVDKDLKHQYNMIQQR